MEKRAGRGLYLVGTAHVSRRSVRETEEVILRRRPRIVGVELCRPRLDSLVEKERWERMSIVQVLRSGKGFLLLAQIYLSMTQRRLGKQFGVEPGSEMLAALTAARRVGADVVLLDRDIIITFRRAWGKMGFREKMRMMWYSTKALVGAGGGGGGEEELDLEALMEEDTLTAMLEEVRSVAPSATEVLLDERDEALALRIRMAADAGGKRKWADGGGKKKRWIPAGEIPEVTLTIPARRKLRVVRAKTGELGDKMKRRVREGRKEHGTQPRAGEKEGGDTHAPGGQLKEVPDERARMVAVVGAGHVKGITEHLKNAGPGKPRERLKELEDFKQNRWPWYKVLGYAFLVCLAILVAYLIITGDYEKLKRLAILWFLTNAICAGVCVAVVGGHPASVGAAFIAAPFTSLNPSVGAGWVAGLVEAKVRTPTVKDMKALGRIESMRQFFRNRAVRVLMVAAFGNLGSTIGSILFVVLLPRVGDLSIF